MIILAAAVWLTTGFQSAAFAAAIDDGMLLMKQQHYAEAISVLEKEAKEHPGSADVLVNLGWAYERVKRPDDARRCYDLLVRLDPKNPTYLRLLAELDAQRRDYANAMKLCQRAMTLSPGDKDVTLTYARILMGQKQIDRGGAIIQRLHGRYPRDPAVEFAMADYLADVGRLDDALNYLDRLVRDDPSDVSIRRERADVLYRLGYAREAIGEWQTLAAMDPPDEKSLINLGWAAWHDNLIDQAEVYGEKLMKIDPDNPVYLRFLAHIKIEQRDAVTALALGLRALKYMPDDRDTLLLVAKALFHLQRDQEAMKILNGLLAEYPDNEQIIYQMADFLTAQYHDEEALKLFNRLVEEHPDNLIYRKRQARANYAVGNFDAAVAGWKFLHEKDPYDADPLEHLMDDATNRKAWDEAIYWIRQLAGARSLSALTWVKLGRVYRQLGHLPQALEADKKSYETDPTFLAGLYEEAEVLEDMQEWEKARAAWSETLRKNPNSIRSMLAMARVEEGEGHLLLAAKVLHSIRKQYFSEKTCPAYIEIYEARLLADARKYETAMRLVKLAERKDPSVPILLYHGISAFERGEALWKENFRKQMLAIKKAGYQPITVVELEKFLEGRGKLPDNPILITFDDGRMDSFKNADPILEETGLKATMFVIVNGMSRNPFHASIEDVRYWRGTGRWEIQLHADRSHVYVPVDNQGHKAAYLANRMWLYDQNRLETLQEAEKRIDGDYLAGIAQLKQYFPGIDVIGFAFPFGNFGQADSTNDPRIAAMNTRLMAKDFKMAFLQDQYGYNFVGSKMTEVSRLEIMRETTASELIRKLQMGRPWVKARMLEAQLWLRTGQPRRSLPIYKDIADHGVDQPELWADWGAALQRADEPFEARRMFAKALAEDPGNAQYQMMLDQSRYASQPKVVFGVDGWHDSSTRGLLRGLGHAQASIGPLDLDAYAGHGRYTQNGLAPVSSNEGGISPVLHIGSRLDLHGQYVHREFSSGTRPDQDNYSAGAGVLVWKGLRLDGTAGEQNVETLQAIENGLRYHFQQAELGWDPALNWTLGLAYTNLSYNDQNREWDAHANLIRKLNAYLSAGYSYWGGDSRFEPVDYWTPQRLNQHMGLVGWDQPIGQIMEATGLPRAQLHLQYGAGYGWQLKNSRFVETAKTGLMWRLTDVFFFDADGEYMQSPTYSLVQFNGSIGLTY